jgi:hypothetical protein
MGSYIGAGASTVVLLAAIAMIWICREDLAFSTACSVAAFSLLIPFEYYNEVLLLAPILWVAAHRESFAEGTASLLYAAIAIALCEQWLSAVAISLLHLVNPGLASGLWEVPLSLSEMLTLAIFLAIFYYAFSAYFPWRRTGTRAAKSSVAQCATGNLGRSRQPQFPGPVALDSTPDTTGWSYLSHMDTRFIQ